MNCKQGDMAIIRAAPTDANTGKIVQCVELIPKMFLRFPTGIFLTPHVWRVDPDMPTWEGSRSVYIPDANLRPIRDPGEDAKDEMLRPLPQEKEKV